MTLEIRHCARGWCTRQQSQSPPHPQTVKSKDS